MRFSSARITGGVGILLVVAALLVIFFTDGSSPSPLQAESSGNVLPSKAARNLVPRAGSRQNSHHPAERGYPDPGNLTEEELDQLDRVRRIED